MADPAPRRPHRDRHPGHRVALGRRVRADLPALAPDDDRPARPTRSIYLLRHTHASDMRFLESFHDDELAHGTPMNAVGVLSRADEIGSCRLDALDVARPGRPPLPAGPAAAPAVPGRRAGRRAARRWPARPCARRSSGALAALAAGPPATRCRPAADRGPVRGRPRHGRRCPSSSAPTCWTGSGCSGCGSPSSWCATARSATPRELRGEFIRRSGLAALRTVLLAQFTGRSRDPQGPLGARGGNRRADAGGCARRDELRARVEGITAGAHAFVEVRLLTRVRSGALQLDDERRLDLERLLGGLGNDSRGAAGPARGRGPGRGARGRAGRPRPLAAGGRPSPLRPGGDRRRTGGGPHAGGADHRSR